MGSYMNAMKLKLSTVVLLSCFGFLSLILLWSLILPSSNRLGLEDRTKQPNMDHIIKRLALLRPTIEEMMSRTGTAGLTYGVVHHGEIIHTENFGYRDVEERLPVNEDTIFQVASLTKAMVAAAIGILVEDKKMNWDTPVKEILPEWHVQDPIVRNTTTIIDCLAHRTGLQMNNYWLESNNNIIIPMKDSMKLLNGLIPVKPFRGQFQYNNLGYEVAGHVIEKLSGMTWDQMLSSKIFEPLEMHRTGTHQNFCGPDNVSKAYGSLSNGTPVRIGDPKIGDNTVAGAAGGVRSSLNDMLKLMKVWLKTGEHQFSSRLTSTPGSPLKQANHILSAQIPIGSPSYHETSYALGWARTQLPGPMGAIGLNGLWLRGPAGSPTGMPFVAKSATPQLAIYHQGSNPGVLAATILLPESQSAIVVLSNTLALNDCADWVSQLLVESLLDVDGKFKNDYLQIVKDTVALALAWYPAMAKELRENRTLEIPRNLQDYVGVYYNTVGTVHIDVTYDGEQLKFAFQGLEDEVWDLRHWEGDTFTWLPESRDIIASRGRFTFQSPDYYKIKFAVSGIGNVEQLTWVHEGWNIPEGEDFFKIDSLKSGYLGQKPL
ncbi:hypothetical protein OIDMADRAFT_202404 [Oidiodendron maius Zn]|uniref:Beta-lactamase-related domain-containing protein n=1 Tax=Oidiodendron maius (strain Zn) TaxID=913774 RepID=A0A0C3GRI7_OIDMZ|nr:hypothetical protein OIDMADRAFT_202404 [Oidiodendron maius Zn]